MPVLIEELSNTNDVSQASTPNNIQIEQVNDTPSKSNEAEQKAVQKPIYTGPR